MDLLNSRFNRIYIYWSSIKGGVLLDSFTYSALLKNFEEQRQFEDADKCYFQYRLLSQEKKEFGLSKLYDLVALYSCGYGVRPDYTVILSLILIVIFGILFFMGNGFKKSSSFHENGILCIWSLSRCVFSIKNNVHIWRKKIVNLIIMWIKFVKSPRLIIEASLYLWKEPFVKHLSVKDAYFSTLAFFSSPPSEWIPQGMWKYVVMIEIIFGWVLLGLFIVTLSKIMIR